MLMLAVSLCLVATTAIADGSDSDLFVCASVLTEDEVQGRAKIAAGGRRTGIPSRGSVGVLTIFAQFQGESKDTSIPAWAADLFDPQRQGSFSHFYDTMSFGQLRVTGVVLPKRYSSTHGGSAYIAADPTSEGQYGVFAKQILQAADGDVDFGQFDNDGPDGVPNSGDDDGFVDYVLLNLRSTPQRFLIGGATGVASLGIQDDYTTQDASANGGMIRVSGGRRHGAIQREQGFATTAGAMAHEFGHALGLPDLFDRSFLTTRGEPPEQDSGGIGRWGLMGWGTTGWHGNDGPVALSAWSRLQLGWIRPDNGRLIDVQQDKVDLVVRDLERGGAVVRAPLPPEPGARSSVIEGYLLLEQRVRASSYYNRNQPADGLLVWHVRPGKGNNNDETQKLVDLVCADGNFSDAGAPLGRAPEPHAGSDNLDFWAHDAQYSADHAGNLGDATDMFDGVRYRRLEMSTNPSGLLTPLLLGATQGTAIGRIERRGLDSVVDITLPRWSGQIRNEVRWIGEILVDGDLEVLPGGALIVYPGTRVRVASTDRTRSGLDPARVEVLVRGDFDVRVDLANRFSGETPSTVFEAAEPGGSWYGIIADPSRSGQIRVPDELQVRDATHGMALAQAPAGVDELVIGGVTVLDTPGRDRAGNGDGTLNPGETFAVVVQLDNWSFRVLDDVTAEVHFGEGQITASNVRDLRGAGRVTSDSEEIHPGQGRVLSLPSLTVGRHVRDGETVTLTVRVKVGTSQHVETLHLPIRGRYPEHTASLHLSQQDIGEDITVAAAERPLQVTASATGVTEAQVIVRDRTTGQSVREVPMGRVRGSRDEFTAFVTGLPEGEFEVGLRVRSAGGGTVFSPTTSPLLMIPDPKTFPVLLLLEGMTTSERTGVTSRISRLLRNEGVQASIPERPTLDATLFAHMLAAYRAADRAVIWAGSTMSSERQRSVRQHLESGGRFLVVSKSLQEAPGFDEELKELFGIDQILHTGFGLVGPADPRSRETSGRSMLYRALLPASSAEAFLVDEAGQAAGVLHQLNSGVAGLLLFDMRTTVRTEAGLLVVRALQAMQRKETPLAVEWRVQGRYPQDGILAEPGELIAMQVRVEGDPVAVDGVLYRLPDWTAVQRVSLDHRSGVVGASEYDVGFKVPSTGSYVARIEPDDVDDDRLRGDSGVRIWAPFENRQPILLMTDSGTTDRDRELLRGSLASLGYGVNVLTPNDANGALLGQLLGRYRDAGHAVVWHGGRLTEPEQALLTDYMSRGGQLLVASYTIERYSPNIDAFLEWQLHTRNTSQRDSGLLTSTQPGLFGRYSVLDPIGLAQTILRDEEGRSAGLAVDTGTYRAVYLGLDLRRVTEGDRRVLLRDAMRRLLRTDIQPTAVFQRQPLPGDVRFGNGAGVFDADGDGDLDLYLVRLAAADRMLRNVGGRFVDVTASSGLGDDGRGRGLAVGDYDGDGDLDLYLTSEGANRLWANDGAGVYRDVTQMLSVPGPGGLANDDSGRSAAFFDGDQDGDLDLYVVNATGSNRYFERGSGIFVERGVARGLADRGGGRGLAVGDLDEDGDTDLLIANTVGTSLVLRNDRGAFDRFSDGLGLLLPGGETAALFGDIDNDGDPDLFVSSEKQQNRLWRNGSDGFQAVEQGIDLGRESVGAAFADVDNDGDLDLATTSVRAVVGGDEIHENLGDGRFAARGEVYGLARGSEGRAVVMADIDGDGRQDLLVADYTETRLYRNRLGERHWLQLELSGEAGNRNALGARVQLRIGDVVQTREAQSGYGYGSQVQPRLHFGLGTAERVDQVTVTWPDGSIRSWHDIAANRVVDLAQTMPSPVSKPAVEPTLPLELLPAFPNPSNASVTIAWSMGQAEHVDIDVFDALGQRVVQLVSGVRPAGTYRVVWAGRNADGRGVGSGLYLVRLRAGGVEQTQRLMLLK